LRPEQEGVFKALLDRANGLMTNPGEGLEPLRLAARSGVNANYSGAEDVIADKLLTHGGRSGKFGKAVMGAELSRLRDLGAVDTDFSRLMLEQQDRGSSLAERLLAIAFENEGGTSSSGSQSGTSVLPGSVAGGALAGATGVLAQMEQMALMLGLNNSLQGRY